MQGSVVQWRLTSGLASLDNRHPLMESSIPEECRAVTPVLSIHARTHARTHVRIPPQHLSTTLASEPFLLLQILNTNSVISINEDARKPGTLVTNSSCLIQIEPYVQSPAYTPHVRSQFHKYCSLMFYNQVISMLCDTGCIFIHKVG